MSKIPSVDTMNDAVARISGVSLRVFAEPGQINEKKELAVRGDNAAWGSMPAKHEMPPKEPEGEMDGTDDQDDDELKDVDTKKKEESKTTVAGMPMSEFKKLSGMTPMYEMDSVSSPPVVAGTSREGKTGDVWTGGVSKQNKREGGLPGLEGTAVQDIDPKEGPEGEDHVGDSKEVTFDDAIAMLKKEGVDIDDVWNDFLENRGLSVDLFLQLIDEANESDDEEEINALIAVEDLFRGYVVSEVCKSLGRKTVVAEGKNPFAKLNAKMEKGSKGKADKAKMLKDKMGKTDKNKADKKNPFAKFDAKKDKKNPFASKADAKKDKADKSGKMDKFAAMAKKGKKLLRKK